MNDVMVKHQQLVPLFLQQCTVVQLDEALLSEHSRTFQKCF